MRGFFFLCSRFHSTNQLLQLFSNNNRTIRTVPPERCWFSANLDHVEGRDHELSSTTVVEVETTIKDQPLLIHPYSYVVVEEEHHDNDKLLLHNHLIHDDEFPSEAKPKQERRTPSPLPLPLPSSSAVKYRDSLKLKAISKVSNPGTDGRLPEQVNYLLDFGFSHNQIKDMVRRFPQFAYCSLDGKIKPLIKFLDELGVPKSGIPNIIFKRPQLCGTSLSRNILPTMTYLESLGINKSEWAKVIHRFPGLPTHSKQKIKACFDFFTEMGLSGKATAKILTQHPCIVSYSVEDKLRPKIQYLKSLGISPSVLIQQTPQVLGLSIEASIKPMMNFFLDRGFSMDKVLFMISRFGILYTLSLTDNIQPKWEFFLAMGYDHCELVKFPRYFSFSLEGRIKPRFSRMVSCAGRVSLTTLLLLTDVKFEELIQKKLKKLEACNLD